MIEELERESIDSIMSFSKRPSRVGPSFVCHDGRAPSVVIIRIAELRTEEGFQRVKPALNDASVSRATGRPTLNRHPKPA